jgi:protein required for attachment to host cells
MPLPHNALVLVADGRKMLFFRNHGDAAQLDLRIEAHDERVDAKNSELHSDAPGLGQQRFGFGRPAMDEVDRHQLAEDQWARDAADLLNRRALANDYRALTIVAPPRTLGELRKHLHKETEKRIIATFNKAMTDRPLADIEDLLVGEGAPPA